MKVLLVNPARSMQDSYVFPPLHIMYIAQSIRRTGHEAEIVDIPYLISTQPEKFRFSDDSGIDYVLSKEFDILGIGSVVSSYAYCERLVNKIREKRGQIPIILGGSVGYPIRELWEQHAPVDYLCESDGELVIERFMKVYPDRKELMKIPGLYHLNQDGKYAGVKPDLPMNLDYIPFLNFDEVDLEYFFENQRKWIKNVLRSENYFFSNNEKFLPLIFSRGCVYKCTFCFHFNQLHRKHSPKYIADNIEFLMSRYGATAFQVIDDLTIISKDWLHEICDEIIRRNIKTSFFASGGKPSVVDRDILVKMKQAGFKRISYGIESGSQTILNIMKKQTTVEDNYRAVTLMKEVGIPITVNIVFGMPGESERTMDETRDFLISLDIPSNIYYAALCTPYPGSSLFEQLLKNRTIKDTREYLLNIGGYGNYRINLTDMPKHRFLNRVIDIQYRVDLAYYKKRRQYSKILTITLIKYSAMIYNLLVPIHIRYKLGILTRLRNLKNIFQGKTIEG